MNLHDHRDEACVVQILQDEIYILVDLAGHTAGNRLVFLAQKQHCQAISPLYGTTGLSQVDYG